MTVAKSAYFIGGHSLTVTATPPVSGIFDSEEVFLRLAAAHLRGVWGIVSPDEIIAEELTWKGRLGIGIGELDMSGHADQ
jgi:hypothetical protein